MKLGELVLAFAAAHKAWHGCHTALLVSHQQNGDFVDAIGEQSGTHTYDTPIVNILQAISVSASERKWLYCTYEPSEMDLGMACMRKVEGVVYLSGGTVKQRLLSDETGPGAEGTLSGVRNNPVDVTKRPDLNASVENPGGGSRWSDTSWVTHWYAWLDGHKDYMGWTSWKPFKSYGEKVSGAYNERPAGNITAAREKLDRGLDAMVDVPTLYPTVRDRFFMMVALALVGRTLSAQGADTTTRSVDLPGGHNVGAILLGPTNRILAWGVNMMTLNGTFHAETAMLLAYLRRTNTSRLPDGCRLYTSLKPCHMCAGFIATVAKDITVFVAQDDPKITNSALDKGRGTNITQAFTDVSLSAGTAPNTSTQNMTVVDVLRGLFNNSGHSNAIPFLYSQKAATFFTAIRTRPDALRTALDRYRVALERPASLELRPTTRAPVGSGAPVSRNLVGLDLVGAPVQTRPAPLKLDVLRVRDRATGAELARQMQAQMPTTVGLASSSPTLDALDLAIGGIDAVRHLRKVPNVDRQLAGLIRSMGAAHSLLSTLRGLNLVD